ncbi:PhzF family phenazine biosynthesis protein [Aquimarina sp. MAR_2010_214]|uniref:PhzF family phenazine biosynthesis protein n=1 Tax=Aquimarina sp. MAR_2010_214 TaxID=1250026 RepID=UPI000C7138DC|nr:PhzF family phenazine biosynthesis protein [Aquimarina sp. MAR_2010_214]PKV48554.1 PhzF family phenazine biosynthesis protein [Aquimarina sp. MAR_2010_214]
MKTTKIQKIAAFSHNNKGGNPAGVVIADRMPKEEEMFNIAKEVGYSETAFLHPKADGWRIRYFSPEIEVDFCGHATIATGAGLGQSHGEGTYKLFLNNGEISVAVKKTSENDFEITLQSPETWSKPAPQNVIDDVLDLFNLPASALHKDFPIRYAFAGAKHLILVVNDRKTLADMNYEFEKTKALMLKEGLVTISLLWLGADNVFHSRNAFASGGVYEDPATGAAAAALAGYLRDINWKGNNKFEIIQGEDMQSPSRLIVEYTPVIGASVKISGNARNI